MSEGTVLILTVGLPRSGKSTWARSTGLPIVCPDAIRLALHGQAFYLDAEPLVWAIAKTMVRALFLAGNKKVVVDATNTTIERRKYWEEDGWEVNYHIVEVGRLECLRRAMQEGRDDLIPVIERMATHWEAVLVTPDNLVD